MYKNESAYLVNSRVVTKTHVIWYLSSVVLTLLRKCHL